MATVRGDRVDRVRNRGVTRHAGEVLGRLVAAESEPQPNWK
jgi:hypothetical protein